MSTAPSHLRRIAEQAVPTTRYERPVDARLVVRLDNGEEWDATPGDLRRFGLVDSTVVAAAAIDLQRLLGIDLERHDHGETPEVLDPDRVRTAWLTYRILSEAASGNGIDDEWANVLAALLHGRTPAGPDEDEQ